MCLDPGTPPLTPTRTHAPSRPRSLALPGLHPTLLYPTPRRAHLQIQIGHTLKIARLVGLEAAKRAVKAYVRIQHPFYQCKESGAHDEKEEVKPEGVMGTWWHETLRTLGAIEE